MGGVTTDPGTGGGRRPLDLLVHLLLPTPCLGCGAALPARRAPLLLCPPCRGRLPRAPAPACTGCGRALSPALPAGARCSPCRRRPPSFVRLVAPWLYAPPLDAAIRALKYRRLEHLAGDLAALLAAAEPLAGCDAVVPVPLHWRRRLARGFNQAERIARPLASRLGLPLVAALVRRVPTARQAALDRGGRLRNVAGAFACRRGAAVSGRRLALVDDVVTTGATLDEGARALLAAGAAAVVAVAVARRPGPGERATADAV
jgi:ComF family protein